MLPNSENYCLVMLREGGREGERERVERGGSYLQETGKRWGSISAFLLLCFIWKRVSRAQTSGTRNERSFTGYAVA